MNFSFFSNKERNSDSVDNTAKNLKSAVEEFQKAMQDSANRFNEHRKKAEEEINRGTRTTKHRINL
ncbi:hypothetical protein ACKER8_17010 [Acinetobacter baumannii]|uniref:hypothetical protein n=1 Tax=Acinetobacter baumannii TaxID=470 RepID=UPI000810D79C|nr:hypothetical protein [Acinetobacter baumannii]MDC5430794.1 hypothetical protein [Acinetobacter baumannii]